MRTSRSIENALTHDIDMSFAGGGDARYGNEEFLKNVEAWAASVKDYPEYVAL